MIAAVAVRARTWTTERVAFSAGLAVVGAAAVAACLPGARRFALWQDEVASARVIAEPHPVSMLQHIAHGESTPPLWYALGWLLRRVGVGIVDVRLLSVAAAAALAVGTAVAARRVVPAWAALLAGFAVAFGYQFDFHGRELRAYELAALLTVALAVAAQRESPALLAAAVAAGSLTHYFFLFSVAGVVIWRRSTWRAVVLGLVPLAAWLPVLAQQYGRRRFGFIGTFDLHEVATTYWATFARAQPHGAVLHLAAPLALLAAVIAGSVVLARSSDLGRLWALLATCPVGLAAAAWMAGARVYDVRNVIVAGPFAAVAVAALVARAPRAVRVTGACAIVALLVIGFFRANRVQPVPYDRIAAALVAEGWRPGDRIVVYGDVHALWGPLEWYLPQHPTLVLRNGGRRTPTFVVASRGRSWSRVRRTAAARRFIRSTLVARVDVAQPWPAAHTLEARS